MSQALYDLPEGWEWKRLGDVLDVISGNAFKSEDFSSETGIHSVKITNVGLGVFVESQDDYLPNEFSTTYNKFSVKEGDIVIALTRPVISGGLKVCRVPENYTGALVNQRVAAIVFKKGTYLEFVYWFLLSPMALNYVLEKSKSLNQPNLSIKDLSAFKIPLPPLAEQTRIVEKLDAVLSRIDTAIDELQQSLALVDAMFKSGLDKAFNPLGSPTNEAGLYDLPYGWGWEPLKSVCKFENGDRGKNYPSRDAFVDSGIAVINAGALNGKTVDESELNFITRERFDLLGGGKVRRGDLLFCLRGSLGKCAIVTNLDEGAIASSLVIVRPTESILAEYLLNYFNSGLVVQFITKYNNGAAQPNLSAANLAKFELPLPPLAEQNRIVESLDALNDKTTQLKTELTAKIGMFNQLKASVLDGAFRGEL